MLKTEQYSASQQSALKTLEWLLTSGIQNSGNDPKFSGGMSAWQDLKTHQMSFLYSEITGYAINLFLFFHEQTKDARCLEAAKNAADWLIRTRDTRSGFVLNRVYVTAPREPYYESWIFTFDQWIILYGWANLYGRTRERKYLDAATQLAERLIAQTFRKDGSMAPVVDIEKGAAVETGDKWSREPGGFHAKALMGLMRLCELTDQAAYREAAVKLATFAVTRQETSGRFITQLSNQSTHLHPHHYSIEGLLVYAKAIGDQSLMDLCARAWEWAMSLQKPNGALPSYYEPSGPIAFDRADVLAQAVRVGALLIHSGRSAFLKQGFEKLQQRLLTYQVTEGPNEGGFFYGQEQDGTIHHHLNAWVAMFAAQALWVAGDAKASASDTLRFFV